MSSPMRLRHSPVVVRDCEKCSDTGLIEKPGLTPARYAHEAFLRMEPCKCAAGVRIRPAFECGRKDYGL